MKFEKKKNFALKMDRQDPLATYREQFHIPYQENGDPVLYFCGNSLGLQPKSLKAMLNQELKDWEEKAVEGHFLAKNPWLPYHEPISATMAPIVGGNEKEVIMMNTLTTNLHLMMVSFYRPTKQRHKILMEHSPFPSDQYAVQSQVRYHGFDPATSIIELQPKTENPVIPTREIEELLEKEGENIALVMIGGVNYYTGQAFDIERITKAAKAKGCLVGFDLAHAAGNIPLKLHDWNVDFAVWCTYKYLNGGPGSIAGCFVHEQHHNNPDLPRFEGWWGHNKKRRFLMESKFQPIIGAEAWQLSNPPILSLTGVKVSLEIFNEAGMEKLTAKSKLLTGYLEYLIDDLGNDTITVITPRDPNHRGCQLSVRVKGSDKSLHQRISKQGVVSDWREPDVIRVAPVPLYNSFLDVFNFVQILKKQL
ncbi:MAG: kynureninase [bacterium]|nr:kynureninase [bacterium]